MARATERLFWRVSEKKIFNKAEEIARLDMGARNRYSSINFLGGFTKYRMYIDGNFFGVDFYTVVFDCGEITSETSTMCKMEIAVARAMQRCRQHLTLLSRQTKNPLAIAAWKA